MKIVILSQYFTPEMGAPQSRLLEMANGLKRNGWEVKVVTTLPNYPTGKIFPEYRGRLRMKENIQGMEILRLWFYPSNSKKSLPRILSMISFTITSLFSWFYIRAFKPDYLLVESPPLTLGWSGRVLARLSGAKLITNISDIWPLSAKLLGAISDGFTYKLLEGLERWLYRKSYICTGQSQEIVDHIAQNGAQRTYLFRNGVDPERFDVKPANAPCDDTVRLVYAGLLGVAQGVLDICKHVNFGAVGIEFHIYGTGPERKDIEAFVAANPDRKIFLHEPVKRDLIPAILNSFDGTIIPLVKHLQGAVPSKIYEAMAAGLPILFTGGGEGATIIQTHELGWTATPGDFNDLNEHILTFKNNPDLRAKYKANCLEAAQHTFNRNKGIDALSQHLIDIQ